MLKYIRGSKGFTLLESILAMVIVGAGLTGGLLTMHNVTAHSLNSDFTSIATQLANEKMESIIADSRYRGYEFLSDEKNYPAENLDGDYAMFRRFVSIEEVNPIDLATPEEGSGLTKVNVVVNWGQEDYQSVTVTTLIGDYNDS